MSSARRVRLGCLWVALLLLASPLLACSGGAAPSEALGKPQAQSPSEPPVAAESPTETASAAGPRRFGRGLRPGTPEVALADLLAQPQTYAGKVVRTSGTVARVCQKMGCWMELRVPDGKATLRAPMAGHGFFLPQDVVGHGAVIEGTVKVEPLTEAQKAHYRSEGMEAVEVATSLDAEAVEVVGS